jgi:hypothetical protein
MPRFFAREAFLVWRGRVGGGERVCGRCAWGDSLRKVVLYKGAPRPLFARAMTNANVEVIVA